MNYNNEIIGLVNELIKKHEGGGIMKGMHEDIHDEIFTRELYEMKEKLNMILLGSIPDTIKIEPKKEILSLLKEKTMDELRREQLLSDEMYNCWVPANINVILTDYLSRSNKVFGLKHILYERAKNDNVLMYLLVTYRLLVVEEIKKLVEVN